MAWPRPSDWLGRAETVAHVDEKICKRENLAGADPVLNRADAVSLSMSKQLRVDVIDVVEDVAARAAGDGARDVVEARYVELIGDEGKAQFCRLGLVHLVSGVLRLKLCLPVLT